MNVKNQLVDRRGRYADARSDKSALLAHTREDRHSLEGDLRALEAEQAKVIAALQASARAAAARRRPARSGRARASSSGRSTRRSRPASALAGAGCTPASTCRCPRARRSTPPTRGRVAIAGWIGGYGNYTCIQHTGSLSTCYGHQSRIGVSVGQSVSQGQVIGYSGNTGPLDRPAPALRGPRGRQPRGPDGLPLGPGRRLARCPSRG